MRPDFDLVMATFEASAEQITVMWSCVLRDLDRAAAILAADAAMIRSGWRPTPEECGAPLLNSLSFSAAMSWAKSETEEATAQPLDRQESTAAPERVGMAVITSRSGGAKARARGQELCSNAGESIDDFITRARRHFAPLTGYFVVPEKDAVGRRANPKGAPNQ